MFVPLWLKKTSLTKCLHLSDKPPIQRFPVEGAALAPLPWLTHHCGFFSLLTSGGNLVDQILTNHLHYELVVFFNWVVGCLSPILTQWKAEGDSKVLKSKLVSVATPTSPHYWLVGWSGGSGHARTGTSEECADPTQPGTRLVNPKMVEQNILRKCFSFDFWQTISVWI